MLVGGPSKVRTALLDLTCTVLLNFVCLATATHLIEQLI